MIRAQLLFMPAASPLALRCKVSIIIVQVTRRGLPSAGQALSPVSFAVAVHQSSPVKWYLFLNEKCPIFLGEYAI